MYYKCISRGTKMAEEHFAETLNEVREIVIKYSVDAHVVLVGDLNVTS